MRRTAFFSFLFHLILAACTAPDGEPLPAEARLGHDFFPLERGRFVEYDVEEIRYALATGPTVTTYQVKETVDEGFADATGGTSYRLERFRRTTETQPWRLDSVYTARLETDRAVRTENGVALVKLAFPVANALRWNGNALNANGPDWYEIRHLGQPMALNGQVFGQTLTVVQQADSSLVGLKRRTERYARGVGLVYRESTEVFYCTSPACLGKGAIDFGQQTVYRIRTYGKE